MNRDKPPRFCRQAPKDEKERRRGRKKQGRKNDNALSRSSPGKHAHPLRLTHQEISSLRTWFPALAGNHVGSRRRARQRTPALTRGRRRRKTNLPRPEDSRRTGQKRDEGEPLRSSSARPCPMRGPGGGHLPRRGPGRRPGCLSCLSRLFCLPWEHLTGEEVFTKSLVDFTGEVVMFSLFCSRQGDGGEGSHARKSDFPGRNHASRAVP